MSRLIRTDGRTSRRRTKRARKTKIITVRLTAAELRLLRRAAEEADSTVADCIRVAVGETFGQQNQEPNGLRAADSSPPDGFQALAAALATAV